MMSICQKCGDKGWSVALIYCDKCQIYAQHRYCLDVLPKTFSEYVVWHCESCSSKVLKATENEGSTSSTKSECRGSKFEKVNQLSGDRDLKGLEEKDKEHEPRSLSFINEEFHDAKHKSNHRSDVSYCLGSKTKQVTKSRSGKNLKWKNKKKTHMKTKKKKKKMKMKALLTQSLPLISEELPSMHCETDLNTGTSTKGESLRPETENSRETSIENTKPTTNEKKKQVAVPPSLAPTRDVLPVENPKIDQKLGTDVERRHKCNTQKLGTGVGLNDKCSISGETAIRNRNTFEMVNGDVSHMFEPNLNDPSRPIFEPVWKGSFIISHDKFGSIGGIGAHLSTKAIIPVHREAKLLPEPLCLELVLRSNVWPKGFGSSGPKDDSIGLYFFPQNQRDARAFESLVEYMIEADLAMRARAANSELLVFTSQQLPLHFWRFQAKYYLWGAFRGNRDPSQAMNRDLVSHRRDNNTVTPNASIPKERLRTDLTKNTPEERTDRIKNLVRRSPLSPLSRSGSHGSNKVPLPW